MTLSRQRRYMQQAKQIAVDVARREGRLREATSRCGPWIVSEDGSSERCVKCGDVDFVDGLFDDDSSGSGPMGF